MDVEYDMRDELENDDVKCAGKDMIIVIVKNTIHSPNFTHCPEALESLKDKSLVCCTVSL